jgi:AraC-like DNA-binding protein
MLRTNKQKIWCDYVYNHLHLPIKLGIKDSFIGEISLSTNKQNKRINFAHLKSSNQIVKNTNTSEHFIFINTKKKIEWITPICHGSLEHGGTIVLDCNQDYIVNFEHGHHTNIFVVPYIYYNDVTIDYIRKQNSIKNCITSDMINNLFETIIDHHDNDLDNKVLAIANLSTIDNLHSINDCLLLSNIKFHIYKEISKGNNVCLDSVAHSFYKSKRTLQLFLAKNGTSYNKIVNNIKLNKFLMDNSNEYIYQKAHKAGYKSPMSLFFNKK